MVEGDAKFMRRVNGWLALFWIIMIPTSFYMGWLNSVTFVSALSLWALVSGHWSAWQAARVEVKQDIEEKKDTEGKIAERVIEESNLHHNTHPAHVRKLVAKEQKKAHQTTNRRRKKG